MKFCRVIACLFFALPFGQLKAQSVNELLYSGNEHLRKNELSEAEAMYRKALQQGGNNATARYNLGVSLYKQQKADSAVSEFTLLTGADIKNDIRSRAFFNTGAVYSEQNKLEESIESYKNALRINPNDREARENLQKALLEWKKRNPPKEEEKKKPKQQPPKQPPRPKLNPKAAEQKLKQLEQKEKQTQQKQIKKNQTGGTQPKDW